MTRFRQTSLRLPLPTERLTLREFTREDVGSVREFITDARVIKYLFHTELGDAAATAYIKRVLGYQSEQPRSSWELAVTDSRTNEVLGACNLTLIAPGEGDVGYLLNRKAWGQGYATEIAQALIEAGFTQMKLQRIVATVDLRNTASIKVLEKCGLRWEASFRKLKKLRGETRDCHLYALARAEWEG